VGYFDGYLRRFFVRYAASNKDSYLSGSLSGNVHRSLPRSVLSSSPHSRPGSFQDSSAENCPGNLQSHLASNEERYGACRGVDDGTGARYRAPV